MNMKYLIPGTLATIAISLYGCSSGNGNGLDANGQIIEETDQGTVTEIPLAATLESIQANVFTKFCAECHAGPAAPLGLRLDTVANSYNLLVGQNSVEVNSLLRVSPNDPDNSYLIQKLEGTAAVGGQMPLGNPALPQATIDVIRQWIIDGAQNVASGASLAVVTTVIPDNDSITDTMPEKIEVIFNRQMDISTIDANSIKLKRSGGDYLFDNGNDVDIVPASIEVVSPSNTRAVITLDTKDNQADIYQLTLYGDGTTAMRDISGSPLDGDSNNTDSGNFISTFAVVTP